MRQRKKHIAALAFLMLMLFLSPIAVRALHHDTSIQTAACGTSQDKAVSKAIESCAICHFEFVTFIALDFPDYTHFCLLTALYRSEAVVRGISPSYNNCSLRAPPFC